MTTMSATSQYATGGARDRIERALQATGKSVDSLNETTSRRASTSTPSGCAPPNRSWNWPDHHRGPGPRRRRRHRCVGGKSGCRRLLRGRVLVSQSLTYAAEDFLGERLVVDRACERE
jgi:hypothetical protein